MFKEADPTSRIPTYLQAYTKENLVWQLKLTCVVILGGVAYEIVQEQRRKRRYKNVSVHTK